MTRSVNFADVRSSSHHDHHHDHHYKYTYPHETPLRLPINTPRRPPHQRPKLPLPPQPVPARAQLVDVHPLVVVVEQAVRGAQVLVDKALHQRELGVPAHARPPKVPGVRPPPAHHGRAARVAQAREAAGEVARDRGEGGVGEGGEGVRVGVAAAADGGDFEEDFIGPVGVKGVIDVCLDEVNGEFGELMGEEKW